MLDIAFELIGEATSNSLLMFCFCNIIIVMIFAGSSSKPGSMESQDSNFTTSMSFNRCNIACDDDEEIVQADFSSAQDESLINEDREISDDDEEIVLADISFAQDESLINELSVSDEEEEGDDDDYEVEEEEGDDDDLRKRAEEFIAKINNEWRHEKLRALNLVY